MIRYTDYKKLLLLEEIEQGIKVVIPVSMEHAECMIRVARHYIESQHLKTYNALKANHDNR